MSRLITGGGRRRRGAGDHRGDGYRDPAALDESSIPVMYGEAALAGWKHVVDAVHEAGGTIFPQLWHQGPLRDARKSCTRMCRADGRPACGGPSGVIPCRKTISTRSSRRPCR